MKVFLRIFFAALNLLIPSLCFSAKEDACLNEKILDHFFHQLFDKTTAGYVLFGERAVFLCTLPDELTLIPGTETHKWAIEMWSGLDVLKNIVIHPDNYLLKISDRTKEPGIDQEFLLLNKQATLEAVQQNLPLFKLRFGIRTTADNFVSNLLDPKCTLSSLFQGQHALLGILFGYGSENGMAYERGISIVNSSRPLPTFPMQEKPAANSEQEVLQKMQCSTVKPALGFASINEEINDMTCSLAHPDINLDGTSTKIPFTYLKDSKESIALLKEYKRSQKVIDEILSSDKFFEVVMGRLNAKMAIDCRKTPQNISKELIARSIWQTYLTIFPNEEVGIDRFIHGMQLAETSSPQDGFDGLEMLDTLREQQLFTPKATHRYENARMFMSEIAKQEHAQCIEHNKIYFRTTKPHLSSKQVSPFTKSISAYLLAQDLQGNILYGSYHLNPPQNFMLSELIPGLAHALKGMYTGETREVWIHPDYIYGIDSDFARGAPIKVTIQLIDTAEGTIPLRGLLPHDFELLQSSNMNWKWMVDRYFVYSGHRTWTHFKKIQALTFEEIISQLKEFAKRPELTPPLNEEERRSLLQIHWQLYFHCFSELQPKL